MGPLKYLLLYELEVHAISYEFLFRSDLMVTVMIRFTAFVRINVPSLVNAPLEFIFVNKRPDSNEFPY